MNTPNIWFDSLFQQEWTNEVLHILEKEDLDVICIQDPSRNTSFLINSLANTGFLLLFRSNKCLETPGMER